MKKRAILSVSDKNGIVEFARALVKGGWEIFSTGGTKKMLDEANVPVTGVEEITQYPECFSGRVKTMHPAVIGAILFRRGDTEHEAQAKKLGIEPIDLVCANLYPFRETIGKSGISQEEAMEQIDIGGPTLLRSAAKNHEYVTVVCDPADYGRAIDALDNKKALQKLRRELAAKVFLHTAAYDALITEYLSDGENRGVLMAHGLHLRYGENPHQWGSFYRLMEDKNEHFIMHQGKELSYLNLLDADGAWTAIQDFDDPTAVMVKHANPSGIASNKTIEDAFQRAYDADRISAFGVIIALNRECSKEIVKKIIDQKIFTEIVLAPSYAKEALELLKQKPKLRVLEMKNLSQTSCTTTYRSALCGMLVQNQDDQSLTEKNMRVVTTSKPALKQMEDLLFAWRCVKHAKSNAIVFAKDNTTVGIGAGQTSRVDAVWIAAKRAGERAKGAVMASDAFFPFPDSVEEAAKYGIAAIIQPGGSVRDEEVVAKANELNIPMVMTDVRAFRH